MGVIALQGAFLFIGIGVSLILTVVGLFLGNIILFDSIALAIVGGVCCNQLLSVHPAFCLVIGIAVFVALRFLQSTRFGFWIIGGLLSVLWAVVFGFVAYIASGEDMVWFYVMLGLGFLIVGGLHLRAREKQ